MSVMDLVSQSWEEVGHRVRPHRKKVMVRTQSLPEQTSGGIYIPKSGFYDGMANQKIIEGTIISKGSDVSTVSVGEKVIFMRIVFARYWQMEDKTFVGWVDEHELLGTIDE